MKLISVALDIVIYQLIKNFIFKVELNIIKKECQNQNDILSHSKLKNGGLSSMSFS
ncbi:hypothetical protein [Clostridium sp. ZBS13]|uniref:hypothetical protein n=1 Tax=Clostridium sp. ZBS13 TaxID=2949971 RepID=UPI00207A0CAB|nr:hypothetical protein [Clostridium sp. ZBS13]